jgi:nucleotide-binding universal stress UspA family protein
MFRRIVVATDFSETAATAARYAASIARTYHGTVELVSVWHVPAELSSEGALLAGSAIDESRRATERQLAVAADALGFTCTTKMLEGEPDAAIVAYARETKAELIVTGTQGRTGLAHVLLGSVAERIVRTSDVPVVTVPKNAVVGPDVRFEPKRLLVPVDLGPGSADALRAAVALAEVSHGRVCAAYGWQMPFYFAAGSELAVESERRESGRFDAWVRETLQGLHAQVDRIAKNGTPNDVIREAAEHERSDLVVMATAGRTGLEHFMLGSVTERVLRTVHLPVLTFRRPPPPASAEDYDDDELP